MERTEHISKQTKYVVYFILALVLYFVFFHRLSSFYMRTWDESIYAVNSYEMIRNGNYLVPYFNGTIDYINDKPPLFFWNQILSIRLFGYNEFAVRFPSALYGALTVLMIFRFVSRRFHLFFGLSAALTLCCAQGFVTFHSARTGDMDTMLAFGLTGMALTFIDYLETQKITQLLFYFLFLLIAFFSKSIAAFFLLPAQALYLVFKQREALKDVRIWIGYGLSAVIIAGFLYVRNKYEDQYFDRHFMGYFGRYKSHFNPDHIQPADFYLTNLVYTRFAHWVFLIIPAAFIIFSEANRTLKKFGLYIFLLALTYFFIITLASSKCYWYDVPLFPLLAVGIGYFIWKTALWASETSKSLPIFFVFFFGLPVFFAIKRSHNNDISDANMRRLEVIPEYFHEHKDMPYAAISVVDNNYIGPVLFYKYVFSENNRNITITHADLLKPEEVVIAGNDSIKNYLTSHYKTEQLETFKNATIYKIKA